MRRLICQLIATGFVSTFAQSTPTQEDRPLVPAPRAGHVMVAPPNGDVLMFGGQITGPAGRTSDPLWLWNGRAWTALPGGPGDRTLPAAAYDTDRRALVVYGGIDVASDRRFDDTWEFRDGTWRKMSGPTPGPRDHHAMVYDAARKRIVMFGGGAGPTAFLGDTWTWDGSSWTKLDIAGPPAAGQPDSCALLS